MSIGPDGEWAPGIHSGYSRISRPAVTGIFSCTRKMPWCVSLASTWISMVPGYGVSCGGWMRASAASAQAAPVKPTPARLNAKSVTRRTGNGQRRCGRNMQGSARVNLRNLAPLAPARIGRMAWAGGSALARALPEQDFLFFVRHRLAGGRIGLLAARIRATGRRACGDRVVPAPHLRERFEIERCLRIRIDPRVARHVGNGVIVPGEERAPGEPSIQHIEQALGFVAVPLHRVRNLFRRVHVEMAVLADHGSEPAYLPEQPFEARDLAARIVRNELPGLARE